MSTHKNCPTVIGCAKSSAAPFQGVRGGAVGRGGARSGRGGCCWNAAARRGHGLRHVAQHARGLPLVLVDGVLRTARRQIRPHAGAPVGLAGDCWIIMCSWMASWEGRTAGRPFRLCKRARMNSAGGCWVTIVMAPTTAAISQCQERTALIQAKAVI